MTIALDAMGGDFGPAVTIPAAANILRRHPTLKLILAGDQDKIRAAMQQADITDHPNITIHHCTQIVGMDESPSHALRSKKDSAMRVSVDLVKEGAAQACVSAGNTGALMATARFVLKTINGVDRPAICGRLPTRNPAKEVRMLDLGANVVSSAEHLFQFAVMGTVLTRAIENIQRPRVGLLNIGEEEIKGNEQVKKAAHLLTESDIINYVGYIEGDRVYHGEVDIVVCDGFVGNIALKTLEGAAKLIMHYLKRSFDKNVMAKLAGLIAKPAIKPMKDHLDPGRRNGASFLGLRGIVVKSHGGADVASFTEAIAEAILQIENNVLARITNRVETLLKSSKANEA